MSEMRKLIEAVVESSHEQTDPQRVQMARDTKSKISDSLEQVQDTALRQQLYRAVHSVLDDYAPGWDYDG